ncbi:MAG: tRNA pseudouridine(55) synthase TruB [Actinomycetota bacterium]
MSAVGPEGVLVIDKPAGMTSHDVVARVRRILGTRRVGHTGTLDPGATGVLVCCVGRATRLVDTLQAGTKTYAATATLGVETTSQDLDGEVLATTDASGLDEHVVCQALMAFQGPIRQVPPMVSAVKVGGERLHAKARRGEVVEREPREVVVDDLVVESFAPGERAELRFLVTCSAGTYVRTVAHDLGRALGVGGALSRLRRLANGPFTLEEALTLETLEARVAEAGAAAVLLDPLAALARVVPVVEVDAERARDVGHGRGIAVELGTLPPDATRVALAAGGRLLALHALEAVGSDGTTARTRPLVVLAASDGSSGDGGAADGGAAEGAAG